MGSCCGKSRLGRGRGPAGASGRSEAANTTTSQPFSVVSASQPTSFYQEADQPTPGPPATTNKTAALGPGKATSGGVQSQPPPPPVVEGKPGERRGRDSERGSEGTQRDSEESGTASCLPGPTSRTLGILTETSSMAVSLPTRTSSSSLASLNSSSSDRETSPARLLVV